MTTAWPCKKFYGGAFERPEPQSRMSMPLSVYRRLHFTRFSTTAPERDRLWQQDPLLENLVKCNLRRVSTFYIFRDAREALRRVVTALLKRPQTALCTILIVPQIQPSCLPLRPSSASSRIRGDSCSARGGSNPDRQKARLRCEHRLA